MASERGASNARRMTRDGGLTEQEHVFAIAWLSGATLLKAHKEGYPGGEWADDTRKRNAKEILRRPRVRAFVNQWYADLTSHAKISMAEILADAMKIIRRDPRRVYDENGNVLPPHEWDDDTAAAVSSITQDKDGKIKVTFESKGIARDQVTKIVGGYRKDNAQKGAAAEKAGPAQRPVGSRTREELIASITQKAAKVGLNVVPFLQKVGNDGGGSQQR